MKHLIVAVKMTLILVLLLGIVYPLAMVGMARLVFPHQAEGSLVVRNGHVVGSTLIGQPFTKPEYFHPRPSAAGDGYDATRSGGTNFGPTSRKLLDGVRQSAAAVRSENHLPPDAPVPVDAVTRSGSGLDPDISPEYAELQVPRIARARGVQEDVVRQAVHRATYQPDLGFLGEARVNVLEANLALERLKYTQHL